MKIKYIGFDKDGTLLDTMSAYKKEWSRIIQDEFGINPSVPEKIFLEMAGKATEVQLGAVLKQANINLPKQEIYDKANEIATLLGEMSKAQSFPDVGPALAQLKNEGYKIFVSSGQQELNVQKDLESTGLMQYIDFYAGVRPTKPDYKKGEKHFMAAAEKFKVPFNNFKSQAVFIGDTPDDIRVTIECGIISLARAGTVDKDILMEKGAILILEDFSNLAQVLSNL